jgi:uncharacterized coiled-coil protein SlyX
LLSAPDSSASVGTLVTQIIVAVGGIGGLASGINAIFSRRKTRAEAGGLEASAAAVISDTAASQVARMDARMAAQETRIARQDERIAGLEAQLRAQRRRETASDQREADLTVKLDEYAEWCSLATATLGEHGIVIAPPPDYVGPPPTRAPPD